MGEAGYVFKGCSHCELLRSSWLVSDFAASLFQATVDARTRCHCTPNCEVAQIMSDYQFLFVERNARMAAEADRCRVSMQSLRRRAADPVRLSWIMRAGLLWRDFIADIFCFMFPKSKPMSMCKYYGHVFFKSEWKTGNSPKCHDCGSVINDKSDLRSSHLRLQPVVRNHYTYTWRSRVK